MYTPIYTQDVFADALMAANEAAVDLDIYRRDPWSGHWQDPRGHEADAWTATYLDGVVA
jgi:hypothetical protein